VLAGQFHVVAEEILLENSGDSHEIGPLTLARDAQILPTWPFLWAATK
jgi:hypothetical protein